MAASKDGKSWRCQFYYKDWQGTRHKKNKRGFRTKAEAEQWERDFLQQHSGNLSIRFEYVFRYEGKLYKITIPRGVKVDLGESRYEGPLCVGKILGTTQVIE